MSSNARARLEAADADIDAVRRSLRPDPAPNLSIAAYHCQQAVEKLIKALLVHLALPYLKESGGHDLRRLSARLPSTHPLHGATIALAHITPWGTAFRYPADDPYAAEPLPDVTAIQGVFDEVVELRDRVATEIGPPRSSDP